MASAYRLKDFSCILPNRYELGQMKFSYLRSWNATWNREHRYIVDRFFLMNNPLAQHYKAYMDANTEYSQKQFQGLLLNQALKLMIVFLKNPQQYQHKSMIPILKAWSVWRTTFVRKYLGILHHGNPSAEMLALDEPRVSLKKYSMTKKKMMNDLDSFHDYFYHRASAVERYCHI